MGTARRTGSQGGAGLGPLPSGTLDGRCAKDPTGERPPPAARGRKEGSPVPGRQVRFASLSPLRPKLRAAKGGEGGIAEEESRQTESGVGKVGAKPSLEWRPSSVVSVEPSKWTLHLRLSLEVDRERDGAFPVFRRETSAPRHAPLIPAKQPRLSSLFHSPFYPVETGKVGQLAFSSHQGCVVQGVMCVCSEEAPFALGQLPRAPCAVRGMRGARERAHRQSVLGGESQATES